MTADRARIARRLAVSLLAASLAAACAARKPPTAGPAAAPSLLETARAALREAESLSADQRAADSYGRALAELRLAETASGAAGREAAIRAEGYARLAIAETRCATAAATTTSTNDAALERAQAELRQVREESRRLEERTALLQHALEQTETELIRTQARLKGMATKAEAASAIAEARILVRRLNARSSAAALCRDSVSKAEQQLAVDNYGAAMSLALRAQDLANQALAGTPRP